MRDNDFCEISDPTEGFGNFHNSMKKILSIEASFPAPSQIILRNKP